MAKTVRKAVFPVGGLGTRFLPATKASPKEMLPVVDKPLIQYAVEEAVAAGIEVMVFVTGRNKTSISNHFDTAYELETELEQKGKKKLLKIIRNVVPSHVSCIFIRQPLALGLGHAVHCALPVVEDEPFAVVLADDLIDDDQGPGVLGQMTDIYTATGASVLGTQLVPMENTGSYGIADTGGDENALAEIKGLVEKPSPAEAPSNRAVVGRYILTPRIMHHIKQTGRGAGNEIQLTDAIARLMREETVYAYNFKGTRYDCGDKLGYLQATVDYALKHDQLGDDFRTWLHDRFK